MTRHLPERRCRHLSGAQASMGGGTAGEDRFRHVCIPLYADLLPAGPAKVKPPGQGSVPSQNQVVTIDMALASRTEDAATRFARPYILAKT